MSAPNILTIPPGSDMARASAAYMLETLGREELPRAVVLVPNRRAATTLRDAFRELTRGQPLLLPRMLPVGDLAGELLVLFGTDALEVMRALPPAMPDWQRLCLLATQVQAFERNRMGTNMRLELALKLAGDLAELQDRFTRAGRNLRMDDLRELVAGDFAEHWQQSLKFFAIIAEHWPAIEEMHGMTTEAARQVAVASYVAQAWREASPDYPVFAIGSTASQPSTAELLATIAELQNGTVVLPGLDAAVDAALWEEVKAGHPYFHLKWFLDRWALQPNQMPSLGAAPVCSGLWLQVLAGAASMPNWRDAPKPSDTSWQHLTLIACQHPEEEARVITLLMREAADWPHKRTALITPDESLMDRVAVQLTRYGITVDRLSTGTLATTATGSLLTALLESVASPERMLPLLNLLRHELVRIGEHDAWTRWLAEAEPRLRGLMTTKAGELPPLPPGEVTSEVGKLVRDMAYLSHTSLKPSAWVEKISRLLGRLVPEAGAGQESIEEIFDSMGFADIFEPVRISEFTALLAEQLAKPWRQPLLNAHPNLVMLTPVEARLQQFDRVILGNMQASLWPGLASPGPWLNFAQQQALGLPGAEEHVSLMSHDLLMLGCMEEVFFTWPARDGGAPTTRSPFIERLLTFLALQGIEEEQLTTQNYLHWARRLHMAEGFAPELPAMPRPKAGERPSELPVTVLDELFRDPFKIYARHVLGLRTLDEIDAEPEASDFGSVAHAAIAKLTQHWNEHGAANYTQLIEMTDVALAKFRERPNIKLFWRDRLLRALAFVNEAEKERRLRATSVQPEMKLRRAIALGGGRELTLQGRIDRLEETGDGAVIADYKTGNVPSARDMEEGKAVQLIAYAMMLAEGGAPIASLDYWQLPRAGHAGAIEPHGFMNDLLLSLKLALAQMLDEQTPFLARPVAGNDRFENDYDGISRYDEWAG